MARVDCQQLRKVYDNGQVALADATFAVEHGELVVLVGPSGCGKSTLLRMIAGLETITSGTLRIGERVMNNVAPKDRDIAMVFQNYALYPHMSVAENLSFGLSLRGMPRDAIAQRIQEAAALLGLDALLDRRPRQLSGGQRQRVALGRALVRQPQVFLLDEPLSNLDAKLRLTMRTEIARLHRRLQATMLYVTHDQIEAMTLGQRIVVLNGGDIQQIDTPMRLYQKPANIFVATFLGSPPMNLFRGRVTADTLPRLAGNGFTLDLGSMAVPLRRNLSEEDEVLVGIRPEHFALPRNESSASPGLCQLSADIEAIEPVGNEIFLSARHGNQEIVARVPPQALPAPGHKVTLMYSTADLHFFRTDGAMDAISR